LIGLLAGFLGVCGGSDHPDPPRCLAMAIGDLSTPARSLPCRSNRRSAPARCSISRTRTGRRGVVLRGGVAIACALCRARDGPMVGPRACLAVTQLFALCLAAIALRLLVRS